MSIHLEEDQDSCLITPLLAVNAVQCDSCDEDHGWSICLGWLFWNLIFFFKAPK